MEEDQLSNLPISILHDILSRLPEKDAVRTSVLSKAWAQTWSTFPILSFTDINFVERRYRYSLVDSTEVKEFIDNVTTTLLKFQNQGLAIEQFKLSMKYIDLYDVSKYFDLWFKLATESGARVLKLHRCCYKLQQHYILPKSILETTPLTKLVLKGKIEVDLSLLKIFSLQVLKLERVLLKDEHALQHFISSCPLLEDVTLRWCEYPDVDKGCLNDHLKYVSMRGLPKLKRLYTHAIQEVYVESLCLEKFHYCPRSEPLHKMDFSKCRNLKELYLTSHTRNVMTNKWFSELFANYPFLESLKLAYCVMPERILISSVQLKVLELSRCFSFKEVIIDAPNLLSCEYFDRRLIVKSISFLRYSSQLKVHLWFYSYDADFYNLREFIQNITPKIVLASVSLSIQDPMDALNPVLFQVSSLPPNISNLVIRIVAESEAMYLPIVYELFSSCCPATVSIHTSFHGLTKSFKSFAQFFYQMLKGKNVDNNCFCSSSNSKCWWHDLKDVKVTNSLNIDENVDFKTMLDALSSDYLVDECITFRLEF